MLLIGAINMGFWTPAGFTVAGLAAFTLLAVLVGILLFKVDTKIENRRKRAIDLSNLLASKGFKDLPELLKDYAVGDYSGAFEKVEYLWAKYSDPATSNGAVSELLEKLLKQALDNPDTAAKVVSIVDKHNRSMAADNAATRAQLNAEAKAAL